ncbi:MAG: ester cyclase [Pseudomonadota bacterium]
MPSSSTDYRKTLRNALDRLFLDPSAHALLAPNTTWDLAWPLAQANGPEAVIDQFVKPLREAFEHLHRRDLLFIGGTNRLFEQGQWCAAVTHYVGNFTKPLWGLEPCNRLVFLRVGELYRIENDQIVEAKIIFDLPDLMHQCGRLPLSEIGTALTWPAPATQDGLCPSGSYEGDSFDVVQRMMDNLHVYDPKTMGSAGQTGPDGVWADDMMWYGPSSIGSNFRWEGFVQDHRRPFLHAFPDRKGGNHYCRFSDQNYAAMSGWPSMTMTFKGDYLGQKANEQVMTLRVMDFYRIANGKLAENWVSLDLGDFFAQLGRDLIAESNAMGA